MERPAELAPKVRWSQGREPAPDHKAPVDTGAKCVIFSHVRLPNTSLKEKSKDAMTPFLDANEACSAPEFTHLKASKPLEAKSPAKTACLITPIAIQSNSETPQASKFKALKGVQISFRAVTVSVLCACQDALRDSSRLSSTTPLLPPTAGVSSAPRAS